MQNPAGFFMEVEMSLDNDAFVQDKEAEAKAALDTAVKKAMSTMFETDDTEVRQKIMDTNGNDVGHIYIEVADG